MRMGVSCMKAIQRANQLKREMGDHYISTDHLLLGVVDTDSMTKKLLVDAGSNYTKLENAVKQIRGTHVITDRNAENKYDALKKYSIDLTERAANGKLDPVIGRDDELRRTIQILSRRTKNNPILIGEPGVGIDVIDVIIYLFIYFIITTTIITTTITTTIHVLYTCII